MKVRNIKISQWIILSLLGVFAVFTMGAKGDGCAAGNKSMAPDVSGWWDITYDDTLDVRIKIGGAVYEETIGIAGGAVTIDHNGHPFTFELRCELPEVVCPSEAWPARVKIEQRDEEHLHQMTVTLPSQQCNGEVVPHGACGDGTPNPECTDVCEGEIETVESERAGVIGADGSTFRLYLGAGAASNGVNCLLLGVSLADAELVTTGSEDEEDWTATRMVNGVVRTGYAGGCLWAGDPDGDSELEAMVLSASIEFETGFSGTR